MRCSPGFLAVNELSSDPARCENSRGGAAGRSIIPRGLRPRIIRPSGSPAVATRTDGREGPPTRRLPGQGAFRRGVADRSRTDHLGMTRWLTVGPGWTSEVHLSLVGCVARSPAPQPPHPARRPHATGAKAMSFRRTAPGFGASGPRMLTLRVDGRSTSSAIPTTRPPGPVMV